RDSPPGVPRGAERRGSARTSQGGQKTVRQTWRHFLCRGDSAGDGAGRPTVTGGDGTPRRDFFTVLTPGHRPRGSHLVEPLAQFPVEPLLPFVDDLYSRGHVLFTE